MKKKALKAVEAKKLLKLDLGCGKNPKAGFTGVDCLKFDGVDQVVNLAWRDPGIVALIDPVTNKDAKRAANGFIQWPWANDSVEEVHSSHFIEHLKADERIHFVNELYRVLIPGGKAQIIVPHWSSARAYGDLTHQWPPVSEFWFYYLDKNWRAQNAPHNDFYTCDFAVTWGYSLHQSITTRNQEFQQFAMTFYKEAAQDVIATMVKR